MHPLEVCVLVALIAVTSAEPASGNENSDSSTATREKRATNSNSNGAFTTRPVSGCASTRRACQNLNQRVVTGINNQILQEFTASYVYLAMAMYMSRDDMALPGFAKFFRKASMEEREHGLKLVDYLISRGGSVHFNNIPAPTKMTWISGREAVQDALTLEKVVNGKLLDLHWTAGQVNDPHLQAFLETEYLTEQVDGIKQLSDWSSILTRFSTSSVGEHIFDQELLDEKR